MPALRATLEGAGFTDVRTYLQSGNAVLDSRRRSEAGVAAAIADAIAEGHGIDCPVIVRSPAQLDAVITACPFATDDPRALHVTFLDAPPPAGAFADVDPAWHAPDELVVGEREVYLLCPAGYGRTKLTPAFVERRTKRTATDRNWNTVVALADLARS